MENNRTALFAPHNIRAIFDNALTMNNDQVVIVDGSPGSGKTELICQNVQKNLHYNILITTETNETLFMIYKKLCLKYNVVPNIYFSKASGRNSDPFIQEYKHKITQPNIYLRNLNSVKVKAHLSMSIINSLNLVIVDEASKLTQRDLSVFFSDFINRKTVFNFYGDRNQALIFKGDNVLEPISFFEQANPKYVRYMNYSYRCNQIILDYICKIGYSGRVLLSKATFPHKIKIISNQCQLFCSGSEINEDGSRFSLKNIGLIKDYISTHTFLTPYRAHCDVITNQFKNCQHNDFFTIDEIQGWTREKVLVDLVVCGHEPTGFIRDVKRIIVMLTRHTHEIVFLVCPRFAEKLPFIDFFEEKRVLERVM